MELNADNLDKLENHYSVHSSTEAHFICELINEIRNLRKDLDTVNAEYKECAEGMLSNSLELEELHMNTEIAASEMRDILNEFLLGVSPFSRHEFAGEQAYDGKFKASLIDRVTKILATDQGKEFSDVFKEIAQLKDDFKKYARHRDHCDYLDEWEVLKCNCGLSEIFARMEG